MKPIYPRPILTLSILTASSLKPAKIPHVAAFSTSPGHHHQRRQEEESRAVRVSVWWDFENCHVPVNGNAFRVAQSITNAIRANGIKGPIEITAFGDVMQISRTNQEALSATGINLTHVPSGGKNSADRSLLVDLMYWVSKNPPPAHLLLISGDRDFAGILHRLRMSNYNILLASPDSAPSVLCSAATIMWHWGSLLKGEDLSGKLFNQPPDGPYNSWYGHYKAPLVDPFAGTELSTCSSAVESSLLASEPKLRSIPKSVLNYISRFLNSNPEGISITHLRAELAKSNVDRDLYGYRKFSRFLSAMPHILELHRGDDGNIVVRRVNAKFSDELVLAASEESRTGNGEFEVCTDTKSNNKKNSCEDIVHKSTAGEVPGPKVIAELTNSHEAPKMEKQNDSSVSVKTHNIKMEARAGNVQDLNKESNKKAFLPKRNIQEILADRKVKLKTQPSTNEATLATPTVEVKDLSENNENDMVVPDDRSSAAEYGFFRGMWMKLFGNRDAKHDEALSGKDTDTQKTVMLGQSSEALRPALFSPSSHEALVDGKVALSGGAASDTSLRDSSLSWFKFRSSPKVDDNIEVNGEIADHPQVNINQLGENKVENDGEAAHVEVKSKQLELFAKESFWKEMESFIGTSQGSNIFSKSRTRESLAQNLQKQGPMDLRSVSISDLLHLIDLLISDKKWLEERADARYPFRVTHPAGKPVQNNLPSSNGLSHIFSDRQSHVQESKEKKYQNLSHTGVPQHIPRASSSKLKTEVLTDCKKLVDEIVKEHPEGFNIGGFRKLFFEKYGYALDLQKLGHEKFATLLKIIPGAVVVSNLILQRAALKNLNLQNAGQVGPVDDSHGDSLITSKQDEESDSWDELGPPDTSGSEKDEMDAQLTEKSRKGTDQRLTFYEPLREDDFSDSEDEMSYTRSEDESKSKMSSESALLDILDSWHGQKQGNTKRDGSSSKNSVIDFVESGSNLSTNGSEVSKPTRKPKSQKSYSFVKEVDSKDKLINGILGSLNKSSDKSVDSKVMS
ncbi:hypothetical protein SASPL_145145 [Salvia splendens]|uniref:HTH OST-type domain-containing protein n=1 Tax=Salvia splendens TaxID=180675 RepID=A0A8X8Z7E8_SALSN|nr:uncharacterized protein LOC121775292 isoform X1 [Salvia splendens]KAG6394556.1 hypothetical protein SASPL_145145 [Salvia splendens]